MFDFASWVSLDYNCCSVICHLERLHPTVGQCSCYGFSRPLWFFLVFWRLLVWGLTSWHQAASQREHFGVQSLLCKILLLQQLLHQRYSSASLLDRRGQAWCICTLSHCMLYSFQLRQCRLWLWDLLCRSLFLMLSVGQVLVPQDYSWKQFQILLAGFSQLRSSQLV